MLWKEQKSSIKENPGYRQSKESTWIYTYISSFQWEQCLLRAEAGVRQIYGINLHFLSLVFLKKDDFQHLILLFHLNQLSVTNLFSPAAVKTSEPLGRLLKCLVTSPTICYKSFQNLFSQTNSFHIVITLFFLWFNAFTSKYSHFLSILFLILWARKIVLFHLAAFQLT